MKQFLQWLTRFFLYANVFIAVCAMAFTAQAYYLLHIPPQYDLLILFSGVSTFFTYMLIRVAATKRIEKYEPDERWKFFLKHLQLMRILTILSLLTCGILFFFLKRSIQYALIVPGSISILYGISIPINGKKFRLRDIGITKIFLISFVWAYIGSVLPCINAGYEIFSKQCCMLFCANFLFIFGVTLPFDMKDLKIDTMNNVKTIPEILGNENTFTLAFISLFLAGGIHFFQQTANEEVNYAVPTGISMLITGLTIYLTRKKHDNFLYFGLLDGMILLQFLLIVTYSSIHA